MIWLLYDKIKPYTEIYFEVINIPNKTFVLCHYYMFIKILALNEFVSHFYLICGYICLIWTLRFAFANSEGKGL